MRDDQNRIGCSKIYNKCLKIVFYCKKVFPPSLSLSSASSSPIYRFFSDNPYISACTAFETSEIHILIIMLQLVLQEQFKLCNIHVQVRKLESSTLYLCCHDSQQSFMMLWGWHINIACCHPSPNSCLIICSFY